MKKPNLKTVSGLLCLMAILAGISIASIPGAAQTAALEGELATILDGMQLREAAIQSARGTFLETDIANTTDPALQEHLAARPEVLPDKAAVKVVWGFTGNKFYQETTSLDVNQPELPEIPSSTEICVFDGEVGIKYLPHDSYAMQHFPGKMREFGIDGYFGQRLGLAFKYGTGVSLSREIIDKKATLAGKEQVNGVECYHISAPPDPYGAMNDWWISPDLGYALVKRTFRTDSESIDWVTWDYDNARFNGFWLPSKITLTIRADFGDGKVYWTRRGEVTTESLQVNQPIDAEFFTLDLPEETRLFGEAAP